MSFRIVQHESAHQFLSRAQAWLVRTEAENNLVLGVALQAAQSDGYDPTSLFVTVESEGYVVGCAFRTPPFKVGLTRMPLKAIPPLVEVVGARYRELPGVLGPGEEARYFARSWCGPRALSFRPVMDQRIYQLETLLEPEETTGSLRSATAADAPVLTEWLRRFFEETRMSVRNADEIVSKLIPEGGMYILTVDDVEVSMAGITGNTPNGARIGFVYTPPEERKKGYGSSITAILTRKLLDEGKKFCFLFTDASNDTSNGIYQRIGYEPVADVVDYQFF